VLEIQIACGVYNCVSEENLDFCLKTVAAGTYLETAIIKVNRLPERWSCKACRQEFVKEKCHPERSEGSQKTKAAAPVRLIECGAVV